MYLCTYIHAYKWQLPTKASTNEVSLFEGYFHMLAVDSMVWDWHKCNNAK